jgi:hypothetical protein
VQVLRHGLEIDARAIGLSFGIELDRVAKLVPG